MVYVEVVLVLLLLSFFFIHEYILSLLVLEQLPHAVPKSGIAESYAKLQQTLI